MSDECSLLGRTQNPEDFMHVHRQILNAVVAAATLISMPPSKSEAQTFVSALASSPVPVAAAAPQIETAKTSVTVNIDADMIRFTSFKRNVEEQLNLVKSSADDVGPGAGVSVEIDRMGMPVFFRTGFHYERQSFTQTFNPSGPLFPTSADGTVDGTFLDLDLGARIRPFDTPRLSWAFFGGATWARDKERLTYHYPPLVVPDSRVLSTWKGNFGTSIHLDTRSRIGWDIIDLSYTSSFKKNDADANFRVSTGISFTLGPRQQF